MLLGKSFTDNSALNIAIVILEILVFLGVYASPSIIIRFGVKQSAMDEKKAKRLSILFALCYLLISAAIIKYAKLSILPLFFVVAWTPISYGVLRYEDGKKTNFIVSLIAKLSEIAVYIIVGVITTVVAWGVFYILSLVMDSSNPVLLTVNTVLNWCAGVLVAYPMNRFWVFHSKTEGNKAFTEFLGFVGSRVSTLIIEEIVMVLCVNVFHIDQYISKYVIASVLVIILNYVFAKLFVFKNKGEQPDDFA